MIESLAATIALMCCSLYIYHKVRLKRWLLFALGLFLLTSTIISVVTIDLISIFVFPPYKFIDLVLNLELIISSTIMAIGLGLILKGTWDNYQMKRKTTDSSEVKT